jgi:hypothetical protein
MLPRPARQRLGRELPLHDGVAAGAGRERNERLLVRGLGSQDQLGVVRRKRRRVRRRDRPAHLHRAIAVGAHLAPVDREHRPFASRELRERPLAQDRDELLAQRPRALFVDVALQAEQAPCGHLAGRDVVRDGSLSAQPVDEIGSEFAPRVVRGLGVPPVHRDAFRGIGRVARQQLSDRRQRQVELTQQRHETRLFELRLVVVAIPRGAVDARRHQHAHLVVETKRLDRQARAPCELADADCFQRLALP